MASRVFSIVMCMAIALPAFAVEISGVKFEEQVQPGNLVLNGAGLRKRFFFQVYAIGLYLPKKTANAEAAIASPGAKRVAIHMLRNVGAAEFTEALADGIRANHSEAEARAHEPQVQALAAIMAEVQEAKKGMVIALDFKANETHLLIDGKARGQPIAGEGFYRALLRIWLGPQPVQDDLKQALLGG
ncbi:MAG: chalcone isomerase family protein [Burkholderiales bacterium]